MIFAVVFSDTNINVYENQITFGTWHKAADAMTAMQRKFPLARIHIAPAISLYAETPQEAHA